MYRIAYQMSEDLELRLLPLYLMLFLFMCFDPGSAQNGFVSIDCGSSEDYTDDLKISWVSDNRFTSTGVSNGNITNSTISLPYPQAASLRYFPDHRKKNCYSLPAQRDMKYLIRAGFFYGNYDNLNKPPAFGLTIETNWWTNISFSDSSAQAHEIIVLATKDRVDVCLFRYQDTPFISSLELRPLNSSMYTKVQDNCFLQMLVRVNCGVNPHTIGVRYPDDPYDRRWASPSSKDGSLQVASSDETKFLFGPASDEPPSAVMRSAWISDRNRPISITYTPLLSASNSFYVSLFFAEVQETNTTANNSRIFNVLVNNETFSESLNLTGVATNSAIEIHRNDTRLSLSANFTLVASEGSSLGPLVNAIEIYSISERFREPTSVKDELALSALKNAFSLLGWTGDPCLPEPWDWVSCTSHIPPRISQVNLSHMGLSGSIPLEVAMLEELTDLLLADNRLTGSIPDLSQLTQLQRLHLGTNKLEGTIPESLGNLTKLTELYLDHNNFSGSVPQAIREKANEGLLQYRDDGNACLCLSGTSSCPCGSEVAGGGREGNSSARIWAAATGGMLCLLGLGFVSLAACRYYRRKTVPMVSLSGGERQNSGKLLWVRSTPRASPNIHPQLLFSFKEVKVATANFKRLLGEGRYGPVYYGKSFNDQEIAVKVLESKEIRDSRDLNLEIELISRAQHKNLVRFIGFCRAHEKEFIIYELMLGGTLRDHLVGPLARKSPLNWRARLDIALNAARGLEYLHTSVKVTHRAVKSSNILLNAHLIAKLGDLGLSEISRNPEENFNNAMTVEESNSCYLDPEYKVSLQWTQKSDVFSFGVVLLEIICGREPINENLPENQRNIIDWVRPFIQAPNNVKSIVDEKLDGMYTSSAMWKVVRIAHQCLEHRSAERPSVSQVVRDLIVAIDMESGIFYGLTDLSSDSSMERSIKLPLTSKSSQYNFRTGKTCFAAVEPSADLTPLQVELLEASAEHDLFSLSQSNIQMHSQNKKSQHGF